MSRTLKRAVLIVTVVSLAVFLMGSSTFGAPHAWALLSGLEAPRGDGSQLAVGYVLSVFGYLVVPALVGVLAAWIWTKLHLRGARSKAGADEALWETTLGSAD